MNLPALTHPGLRLLWADEYAGVIALGDGTAGGYLHVYRVAVNTFRVYRVDSSRRAVLAEESGLEAGEVVDAMRRVAGIE